MIRDILIGRGGVATWIVVLALSITTGGCTKARSVASVDRQPAYPVEGQVLLNGQPLAKAIVNFHPKSIKNAPTARGFCDAQGNFKLQTYQNNDGAISGDHIVTIEHRPTEVVDQQGDTVPGPNVLPAKYSSKEASVLVAKISDKPNKLEPFQLETETSPAPTAAAPANVPDSPTAPVATVSPKVEAGAVLPPPQNPMVAPRPTFPQNDDTALAFGVATSPSPPSQPATAAPAPYESAIGSFRAGQDFTALSLLHLHYLSVADDETLCREVNWIPALRRPSPVVRWGVGIVYNAPRNYNGHPRPIGSEKEAKSGTRPNTSAANGNAWEALAYFTGDIGDYVLAEIESRTNSGAFGNILAEAAKPTLESRPKPASTPFTPATDPNFVPEFFEIITQRNFPASALKLKTQGLFQATSERVQELTAGTKSLLPGVTLLGVGPQFLLEKRAKALQLDLLLIFEVNVRPATSADIVNNSTRFRLFTVNRGEELIGSVTLNNVKLFESRRKKVEPDPLEVEITKFANALDQKLAPRDLPAALTKEVVARRVDSLIQEGPAKFLANATELRRYLAQGLLNESDYFAATAAILGPAMPKALNTSNDEQTLSATTNLLTELFTSPPQHPVATAGNPPRANDRRPPPEPVTAPVDNNRE